MTPLQGQLVDRLRDAMERKGMTQADLARAVGVTPKHLSQMLSGKVEGTLTMWQDCFDAASHRVVVRIIRKPKVTI